METARYSFHVSISAITWPWSSLSQTGNFHVLISLSLSVIFVLYSRNQFVLTDGYYQKKKVLTLNSTDTTWLIVHGIDRWAWLLSFPVCPRNRSHYINDVRLNFLFFSSAAICTCHWSTRWTAVLELSLNKKSMKIVVKKIEFMIFYIKIKIISLYQTLSSFFYHSLFLHSFLVFLHGREERIFLIES